MEEENENHFFGDLHICNYIIRLYAEKMSAEISFSHDSGFYSDEFVLTITGNIAYTLHYTLDGRYECRY